MLVPPRYPDLLDCAPNVSYKAGDQAWSSKAVLGSMAEVTEQESIMAVRAEIDFDILLDLQDERDAGTGVADLKAT